ncbi:Disease resistance protein (CC-NBS-LRR class) family [Rhynchospora pubera]|uniref:Disease resistance protein (CC-NBS-LRR class) family n=1 Tax=Rhynchospora pubera TaxID=906938 RepID=A0AAV8FSR6_9POAL|nr:Disease resistance protein (CC-NBS-LRR class) family [Rhynchospora pubera]
MRMLKRIKATLHNAERRENTDESIQLWLTEKLREVVYAADDVLDEWRYEQLKAQLEDKNASDGNPNKRKLIQIPDGIPDQIKEIRSRFAEICKDRDALHLREEDGVRIPEGVRFPIPTGHLAHESSIFGRENEKEEVINCLLSDCDKYNPMVLPIVGMKGLRKITLAQLVYNDESVHRRFDKLGWVWVSNDFDEKRLTKAILEYFSRDGSKLTELSMLQGQLKIEVSDRSVFFVLDDVCNDQQSLWQSLMAPLISAKRDSILVTTRNQSAALVVQTVLFFKLETLPDEQCWKIFRHYALGGFSNNERLNLEELGRKIMNKCRGLPLAVKSIASLLRYENEER